MIWIVITGAILLCGAIACWLSAQYEQRRIRRMVIQEAHKADVYPTGCTVRIAPGWPVYRDIQINVNLAEEDAREMHNVMAKVWVWIDEQYGVERPG